MAKKGRCAWVGCEEKARMPEATCATGLAGSRCLRHRRRRSRAAVRAPVTPPVLGTAGHGPGAPLRVGTTIRGGPLFASKGPVAPPTHPGKPERSVPSADRGPFSRPTPRPSQS